MTALTQAVLGGLVGGALVPYLTYAKEKRVARSAVRQSLSRVEQLRRARTGDPAEAERFRATLAAFEADALSAGLCRAVVDVYAVTASVAFDSTRLARAGSTPRDREDRGQLPGDLAAVVDAARELAVDTIWRPAYSAVTRPVRLWSIRRTAELLIDAEDPAADWSAWRERELRPNGGLRDIRRRRRATAKAAVTSAPVREAGPGGGALRAGSD
ncbi:hypothetical protein [Micromonospora coxensis]|uniref:hypothetical protein n=1 Tax=Micromonospora coxensis TaxID=356852 RepID=UPI003440A87E